MAPVSIATIRYYLHANRLSWIDDSDVTHFSAAITVNMFKQNRVGQVDKANMKLLNYKESFPSSL